MKILFNIFLILTFFITAIFMAYYAEIKEYVQEVSGGNYLSGREIAPLAYAIVNATSLFLLVRINLENISSKKN